MNRVRDSLDMLHNCPRNCSLWLCLSTPHSISSQYLSSDIAAISKRSTWIVFTFHCICQTGVTLSMQTWFDRFDCNGTLSMLCKLELILSQYYLIHLWVRNRYQNNFKIQNVYSQCLAHRQQVAIDDEYMITLPTMYMSCERYLTARSRHGVYVFGRI